MTGSDGRGLFAAFTFQDAAGHDYSPFTLFPGGYPAGVVPSYVFGGGGITEMAGHGVWTALVGAGIGFARRFGFLLWPLPLFLLAWVTLDHMVFNHRGWLGPIFPDSVITVHAHLGAGHLMRPALLLLVVLAVWIDYRTLAKVRDRLPPIPGSAAQSFRFPFVVFAELRFQWRVLRTDGARLAEAMAYVRSRRELAYGLVRAGNRPRRDAPPFGLLWHTGGSLHVLLTGGAAALVLVLWSTGQAASPGADPMFLAPQLERLGNWWSSLNLAQQALIMAGVTAALMLIPGVGFWAALGWSTLGAGIAASGRDLANTIRHGTPGDLLYAVAVIGLGRHARLGFRFLPKGFTVLPGNRYQSPAGLVYAPGPHNQHRLEHMLLHGFRDPSKPLHSTFRGGTNANRILRKVDQAWRRRGNPVQVSNGREIYEVDMGRPVGANGQTRIRIVVKQGTSEIVTAFPF